MSSLLIHKSLASCLLCVQISNNFLISHSYLQLAPTLKPTPTPVETTAPIPVPVPESPAVPEPINPTPAQTESPINPSPDFVLPGSTGAPSKKEGGTDAFSEMYPGAAGAPSSAYIHSMSSVMTVIAVGSAMVWTLAGFM